MVNVCFTSLYNILDPSEGAGVRVLGLLKGLAEIEEIKQIIVLCPFKKSFNKGKINVHKYLSHRDFRILSPFHKINIIDEINPFRMSSLLKIISKYNINVIQNESMWGGANLITAARCYDVPLIIDEHHLEARHVRLVGRSQIYCLYTTWLESNILKLADHVVTVSEEDKRECSSIYNIPSNKITVIPNGVDTVKFRLVDPYEKLKAKFELQLNEKFVLVFHGPLNYEANKHVIMNIIDFVLPQIIKRIPNAFFLIIGKNPPSVPYDPRFLKFTGYVSDLTKYLAASDVAILPFSKGGRCKVKILEYLAMGIPVVATKKAAEGLPLRNGVNAMLSDAVDCEFINNVLALYNDSSLYEKISKNGRALSEKYDWRIICNRLFQLYRRLLT